MKTSLTPTASVSNRSMIEPEVSRLQRDAENLTHRLEVEKRIGQALDETIKELSKKLTEKAKEVDAKINWKKEEQKEQKKVKSLENNLEASKIKLSELKTQNKELRDQIESMRRNKRNTMLQANQLEDEIERAKFEVASHSTKASKFTKIDIDTRSRILGMKVSMDQERSTYSEKLSQLESIIVADKRAQSEAIKSISCSEGRREVTETTKLVKMLVEKWRKEAKEKRRALEKYRANIKKMNFALETMSSQSGISQISYLVNNIITSLDSIKDLETYIVKIHASISELEEELKTCLSQTKNLRESSTMSAAEKDGILSRKNRVLDEYTQSNSLKSKKLIKIRESFEIIKEVLLSILGKLKILGVEAELTKFIDETLELNERNISSIMNLLDEKMTRFITLVKRLKNDPDADIAMLDLERLQSKAVREVTTLEILDKDTNEVEDINYPLTYEEMRRRAAAEIASVSIRT
jgi:hypothetical protein